MKEISKKTKEILFELAYSEPFSIFNVLSNSDYEIRHSSMIAWLLNKHESHGYKERFVTAFLKKVIKDKKKKNTICDKYKRENVTIYTEYPVNFENKKGRIDIFIEGETFTCSIENKYGSQEHDQCQLYKNYINNVFSNKRYENIFVYLDITKPEYYDKENSNYEGYDLVLYKEIAEILKELESSIKQERHIKDFINQYIRLIDNSLSDEEITKYNNILSDQELTEAIKKVNSDIIKDQKLLYAKNRFEDYILNVQDKNDKLIRQILEDIIVRDAQELISYHAGHASKSNPYGGVISLKDIKPYNQYIGEIDFLAKNGNYSVNFYYGLRTNKSRNWIEYAIQNPDILYHKLEKLKKCTIFIENVIKNGYGYSTDDNSSVYKERFKIDSLEEFQYIINVIKNSVGAQKKHNVIKNSSLIKNNPMIKSIDLLYPSESKIEVEKKLIKYFDDKNKVNNVWILGVIFNDVGDNIISDEDRESIKDNLSNKYVQILENGLNLFDLGTNFVNDYIKIK